MRVAAGTVAVELFPPFHHIAATAVFRDQLVHLIAALARAFGASDAQHVELAFYIAEDEVGSVARAYSITSSARASSDGGTVRPTILAVSALARAFAAPPKNKRSGRAALPGPLAFPFPPSRLLAPAELCARRPGPLVSHLDNSGFIRDRKGSKKSERWFGEVETGVARPMQVYRWLDENADFRDQYARAREEQADKLFREIIEIADDASGDYVTSSDGQTIVDHENIQRSRLRVDARKWAAARLAPRKYGDRVEHDVKGGDFQPAILIQVGGGEREDDAKLIEGD